VNVCRKSSVLLALLGACGESDDLPTDAPVPLAYAFEVVVGWTEPEDRPFPDPIDRAYQVYIDGTRTKSMIARYETERVADGWAHVLELRSAGRVLLTRTFGVTDGYCLQRVQQSDYPTSIRYVQPICAYWSGDLRLGIARGADGSWACGSDDTCRPACGPHAPCAAGERCTSRTTSLAPLASHLACAPVGPKQLGEACALVDDPGGAYDDCGAGLLCVDGACRAVCEQGRYLPGQPPELRLCPGQ
jgi:hypothetical protein